MHLFVFGLGYSAGAAARAMQGKANWIGGTTRTVEKVAALTADDLHPFIFDGASAGEGVAQAVHDATHLIVSISPGESDPVLAHHHAAVLASPNLRWIGYLSTVGVYGNYGGAWVTERTTPHPASERTKQRVTAEKAWAKLAAQRETPLATFRIAGIYGPGRNAFVKLVEGRAHNVAKPGQVFNRIHVADLAATLVAAIERNASGVFNVADDEPTPSQDVVAYAADLMGVAPPPEVSFAEADLSPLARTFYADNKRVANQRIKQELNVSLRYPNYREGLGALWRDGNWR